MVNRIGRIRAETLPDGRATERFLFANGAIEVELDRYGARLTACRVAGRSVILGHDAAADYVDEPGCLGATIGRFANRIAGGRFTLDGVAHAIPANNGPNALHGGPVGFDRAVWRVGSVGATPEEGVLLLHDSPDGDQGFPGAIEVALRVTLAADGTLGLYYEARSDRTTVVNLTNHAYFNLAGEDSGDILGHWLEIAADRFTPVGPGLVPTGEIRPVDGTPFDFRGARRIGCRIEAADEQLALAGGYDHNFVLSGPGGEPPGLVARLLSPRRDLALEVRTTEPGLQFYSGNFLGAAQRRRDGAPLGRRAGACLEAQHFPDSPNQPGFPSTVLRPGDLFRSATLYRFVM